LPFQRLLDDKHQENIDLKNELNLLKDQMPNGSGEDDDIMRAVEERVKQWKVWFFLFLLDLLINQFLFSRIFLKQKMMKLMILREK
jgi:hypothetical protein